MYIPKEKHLIPSISESDKPSRVNKKKGKKKSAPSTSSATKQKSINTSQSKSTSRTTSRLRSAPKDPSIITASQTLPLVIGKTYLKVENIDLEKLSVNFVSFFNR